MSKKESLVITAAGLSIETLLLALIRPYCDTEELILIVNGSNEEAGRVAVECACAGAKNVPLAISSLTQAKRNKYYNKGGVYFASSQEWILVENKNC